MAPGAQIPGLGFAKPNEKLPPLPNTIDNTVEASTSQAASIDGTATKASATAEETEVSFTVVADAGAPSLDESQTPHSTEVSNGSSNASASAAIADITGPDSSSFVPFSTSTPDGTTPSASNQPTVPATDSALSGTSTLEAVLERLPPTSKGRKRLAEDPGSAWLLEQDRGKDPEWEFDDSPYQSDESSSSSSDSDTDSDSDAGPDDERYVPMSAMELRKELNKHGGDQDGSGSDEEESKHTKKSQVMKKSASKQKTRKKGANVQDEDSKNKDGESLGVEDMRDNASECESDEDDETEYKSIANALASLDTGKDSGVKAKKVSTKNELSEPILPKPNVEIQGNDELGLLGYYLHAVEHQAVVQGAESLAERHLTLELETVVCTADRRVVGAVADVMGNLRRCFYVVHIDEETKVELALEKGTKLHYLVRSARQVDTKALRSVKGSDASNQHDEEVDWANRDFSDDEEEKAFRAAINKQKRENKGSTRGGRGGGGNRGGSRGTSALSSNTALPSSGGLPYDEDEAVEYTPLKRPTDFGQSSIAGSTERSGHPSRGRGGRRGGDSNRGVYRNSSHTHSLPPREHLHPQIPPANQPESWTSNQSAFAQLPQRQNGIGPNFPVIPYPPPASNSTFFPPPPPGWPVQQFNGNNPHSPQNNPQLNVATLQAMIAQIQQSQGSHNAPNPNNQRPG